jgi:preprotein translocase subunit SecF
MELFKNTNFDFLGKKWPFIIASLVLTVAGIGSLVAKGGPKYGIDFTGGAEILLRFNTEPPLDKIRTAVNSKVPSDVQQVTGKPEVVINAQIQEQKALNENRRIIEETLRTTFGDPGGKLDLNNSSAEQLADRLRGPLQQAGIAVGDQALTDLTRDVEQFRAQRGGLVKSLSEVSGVPGMTPQIMQVMEKEVFPGPFTILSADVVGPKIGAELRQKGVLTVLYALAGMLVYIAFRFEWIYGVAAVIAVFHDTVITIGLFSLVNKEISLTVVAAVLTLVGYSMNDTIVVFDRIRENLKLTRRENYETLVNSSINQTLSRTVLTSGLTLLTALSLWLFGGSVLNGFSFALVVGIIIGTYSSIFIASPILIFWRNFRESRGVPAVGAPKEPVAQTKAAEPRKETTVTRKQTAGPRKAAR